MVWKTICLTTAIILAYFGVHAVHPFLLHCLDEGSPLVNNVGANVILCDLDDDDPTYPSCETSQDDFDQDKKLRNLLEIVKRMEVDNNRFEEGSKGLNMSEFVYQFPNLENLANLRREFEKKIHRLGVSRLVQKVWLCRKEESKFFGISEENVFRIASLIGILILVAVAARAIFRLHKIADYKVGFVLTFNNFIG